MDACRHIEEVLVGLDERHGTTSSLEWAQQGDTLYLPLKHTIVQIVQKVYDELVGRPLPDGLKLFIDDGNIHTTEVFYCVRHARPGRLGNPHSERGDARLPT